MTMNLFVKYLLFLYKNTIKVKYYILFSSALFILILFFDSKSSKSESYLNNFVHELHTTKKPLEFIQEQFDGKKTN